MKRSSSLHLKNLLCGFLVFCAAFALAWLIADVPGLGTAEAKITAGQVVPDAAQTPLDRTHPRIQAAMAVQERHTPSLMNLPDVVGTATGLGEDGAPAILVFVRRQVPPGAIPMNLDGETVVVRITGEFVSMAPPAGKGPGSGGGGSSSIDPTARFARPVPIGVSTGNERECSAGTISARVKKGTAVYALSNNHVYALENTASIGSTVHQPGRYDTNCVTDPDNGIGALSEFEPIVFSTAAGNVIDAAIAMSSTENLGQATPSDGYGMPKSATVPAALDAAVQKYGRTTSLTKGAITGINATVNVGYSSGTARFVNQIVVSAIKPFIKAGDSGSLLVTDPGRNPVGLLFAGSGSGKTAIANPINAVLTRFGVAIDGE